MPGQSSGRARAAPVVLRQGARDIPVPTGRQWSSALVARIFRWLASRADGAVVAPESPRRGLPGEQVEWRGSAGSRGGGACARGRAGQRRGFRRSRFRKPGDRRRRTGPRERWHCGRGYPAARSGPSSSRACSVPCVTAPGNGPPGQPLAPWESTTAAPSLRRPRGAVRGDGAALPARRNARPVVHGSDVPIGERSRGASFPRPCERAALARRGHPRVARPTTRSATDTCRL